MSTFHVGQVAEIIVVLSGGERRGSGYQISRSRVLTAAHVVADAEMVAVRFDADQPEQWKSLSTVEWLDNTRDLALLTLDHERPTVPVPAGFARLGAGHEEIEVHTAGFPKWKLRKDEDNKRFRDLHQAFGRVAPLSNRRSGTLEITLSGAPAHSSDGSPWEAMSGAAVWAADRIIGIVTEHNFKEGLARLTGARLDLALKDAQDADGRRLSDVLGIDPAALPDATVPRTQPRPAPAPALPGLRAYRLPVDWIPGGGPCPVDDAHLADLGALLCLERGPATNVVAARPGTALAAALSAVEEGPVRRGSGPATDFPERSWRAMDAETALRDLPATSAATGFVVPWPVGVHPRGMTGARSVREVRAQIRAAAPDASVVVLVEAEQAVDAIAAATHIGRELRAGRAGERVEVLTLIRPGEPPDESSGAAAHGTAEPDGHRLMATVAAEMQMRTLAAPPCPYDGEPLPPQTDPMAVAGAVVEMLNRSAAWGPPEREAHALGLVRDFAPRYFPALLRRHAAHRSGPTRWASLSAVAGIDDHVTIWLESVPEVDPPSRVPRLFRDRRIVESVLLGLLRTGAGEAGAWREAAANGRCRSVQELADYLASDRPAAEFLSHASAGTVVAAVRAEQYHLLNGGTAAPQASQAWWAMLGRRPLTESAVRTLAALSVESRRVAGFTVDRSETDPDLAELTHQMRMAMWPPLPGKEAMG